MSRKIRAAKRSIFLACEGHTEEKYFMAIGDVINDSPTYSLKVRVQEIEDGVPQDPVGLVKWAKEVMDADGYDEAWAIFDKDRERNKNIRQQAFAFAIENSVRIAFSSISFETWILHHFEKCQIGFFRSDCESRGDVCICNGDTCICRYLIDRYLPGYKKGGSYKLFNEIKDKNLVALENSAWLRFMNIRFAPAQPVRVLNPHTDVDVLVRKLLELKEIRFGELNTSYSLSDLNITLLHFQNSIARIELSNNRLNAFPVNNLMNFKVRNGDNSLASFNGVNGQALQPGSTVQVDLIFTNLNTPFDLRYEELNQLLIFPVDTI